MKEVVDLLDTFFKFETKSCDSCINGGLEEPQQSDIFLKSQVVEILELPSKIPPLAESFLKQKYLEEGLSSAEIGALIFSSRGTVTKHLKLYEIPLKTVRRRENGKMVTDIDSMGGGPLKLKRKLK